MTQVNSKSGSKSPLKSKPLIFSAIGIVSAAILVIFLTPDSSETADTAYYEATRGDFLISIVEGGSLQAVQETTIRSEVEGTARVISIVPEGSVVKAGDILVQLDSGAAEDQKNQQEIAVRNAELALTSAIEQMNIAGSQTNSNITAASINVELMKIELEKFVKGDLDQQRRILEQDIELKNAALLLAEQTYINSSNLYVNDFETKRTVDTDRITWKERETGYINATNQLWMFLEFEQKQLMTTKESDVEEAIKNLDRVNFESRALMAENEADVITKRRTLELNKEKLERDIKNVEGCVIRAPTGGLVVYPESRSRFSSESMIEEGATVRYRQELIKLPDTSKMKLTVKVHESHVGNVQEGLPAFIVLDPMPEKRFRGTVSRVSVMPNSADRWSNPNLKVYDTEILLDEELPESVKPGVSAKAEIVIKQLKDVITVPVQAVTTLKGNPVVYLADAKPKPVPVEVGMFNTKKIQIISGINEGDRVLLSPPLDASEGSIDGSILEEGIDIEITNQVTVAKTTGGNDERERSVTSPTAGEERQGGRQGGGGFDREAMMKQYDKDGDGELNEEERQAMRTAMQARFGAGGGSRGGGGQGGGGSRGGGTREDGPSGQ